MAQPGRSHGHPAQPLGLRSLLRQVGGVVRAPTPSLPPCAPGSPRGSGLGSWVGSMAWTPRRGRRAAQAQPNEASPGEQVCGAGTGLGEPEPAPPAPPPGKADLGSWGIGQPLPAAPAQGAQVWGSRADPPCAGLKLHTKADSCAGRAIAGCWGR